MVGAPRRSRNGSGRISSLAAQTGESASRGRCSSRCASFRPDPTRRAHCSMTHLERKCRARSRKGDEEAPKRAAAPDLLSCALRRWGAGSAGRPMPCYRTSMKLRDVSAGVGLGAGSGWPLRSPDRRFDAEPRARALFDLSPAVLGQLRVRRRSTCGTGRQRSQLEPRAGARSGIALRPRRRR
jgi:hypothetical protein